MTAERMIRNKPISTKSLVITLFGEILNEKELKNFLYLYSKLTKKTTSLQLFLRSKRNYPFYIPGVQHKDVTYYRGQQYIAEEYIIKNKNLSDLYLGKVSFSDIAFLKKQALSENIALQYPFFIGDILQYMIHKQYDTYQNDISEYIEKKYTLFLPKNTKICLNSSQKEILTEILSILKACIPR